MNPPEFQAYENFPCPLQIYSSAGEVIYSNLAFREHLSAHGATNFFESRQSSKILWLDTKAYNLTFFALGENSIHSHVGVIFKDVTREVNLNEELARVTFLYENAEEIGQLGSWSSTLETKGDLAWSKHNLKIFNTTEGEFDGKLETFLSRIHDDDRERVISAAGHAIATGKTYEVDHRYHCPDGSLKWIRERGKVIPAAGSRPDRFVGVSQDITEKIKVEGELKKLTHRFKTIFESNLIGFFVTYSNGSIVEANSEFLKMTGYTKEDLLAGKLSWRDMTPPEYTSLDDKYLEIIHSKGYLPAFEKEYLRKDGSRVHVLLGATMVDSSRNEMIAFAFDISEKKALERKMDEVQRLDALGLLAGGVAHDFNNILSISMLHLEKALSCNSDIEVNKRLLLIREHSERAKRIIQQLMTFSKNQTRQVTPISLSKIIEDMNDIIFRLIPQNVAVTLKLGAKETLIRADIGQIEQVLLNLVSNARDAMLDGGTLQISTYETEVLKPQSTECAPGSYLVLEVKDSGEGIDPHIIDKVFDPFFSTKEFGKGTGLGLSTVYGIVKQSHGYINVDSKIGSGTKFKLYFPKHRGDTSRLEQNYPQMEHKGNSRVLVVEDQAELRELIVDILESKGYQVAQAESGVQALEKVKQSNVDLIITDVVMPEVSGPSLMQKLEHKVPVLYISGYTNSELNRYDIELESGQFLAKPFSSAELLSRVASLTQNN